jgi:hypothetical protein
LKPLNQQANLFGAAPRKHSEAVQPCMLSEEDVRLKRVRGPALSVFGSFIFALSTLLMIKFTGDWTNLGIAILSVAAIVAIDVGLRIRSVMAEFTVLLGAGVILATEVLLVAYYMPPLSSVYGLLTLMASLLTLRGVRDIEDVRRGFLRQARRELERELV